MKIIRIIHKKYEFDANKILQIKKDLNITIQDLRAKIAIAKVNDTYKELPSWRVSRLEKLKDAKATYQNNLDELNHKDLPSEELASKKKRT